MNLIPKGGQWNTMWKKAVLFLVMLGVVACSPSVPSLPLASTPVGTPVLRTTTLTSNNAEQIGEVDRFVADGTSPVAALAFNDDVTVLLAVYAQGLLRRWKMEDGVLLSSFDIGPVSLGATVFDGHARLLAMAAGATPRAKQAGYATDLNGAKIWDTETGELQIEIKFEVSPFLEGTYADITLSPDGQWLIGVRGAGLESWNAASGKPEHQYTVSHEESAISRMDAIAFDAVGEYTAVANENGAIDLDRWQDGESDIHKSYRLESPKISFGTLVSHPLAIAFDSTRHWLAVVRDEQLEVWDLRSNARHFKSEIQEVSPAAGLAFNPSGELLAVGTKGGWQIWGVSQRELLMQGPRLAVYALVFSPDGRLLARGDTEGVVHLWGVPEE